MPTISTSEWNNFLRDFPDVHILQTAEWGELKSGFGWDVENVVSGQAGVQILFRKLPLGFSIAYIPKPLFGEKMLFGEDMLLKEIDRVCRKHRAVFLKVELDGWEDRGNPVSYGGWKQSSHNIQPPRTIVINIDGSEDEILGRMKQKCRYNIRLAEKKGVVVRAWEDVGGFHQLMQATGSRDGFGIHSLEYYSTAYKLFHSKDMAELFVAEFEGKPLAALMVFARGERSWYLYGASNDDERARMPTYLLQWQAIRWAKSHGCSEYDLWGVPDEEEAVLESGFETRSDGLWGVYRFKRGFGGRVLRAVQALDRVYHPFLYALYLRWVKRD